MSVDFRFSTVAQIVSEVGAAERLGDILVERFPDKTKVCLVTDKGLIDAGLVAPVEASLAGKGLEISIFGDVEVDPPEEIVEACLRQIEADQSEVVVGLGGGSTLDTAKAAAALANTGQPLDSAFGINQLKQDRQVALVQIPTTAGTGSEVTEIAIITRNGSIKLAISDPQLMADLAVLDAGLTRGLPADVTAAAGVDAIVHAIEAYTTRGRKNPLSDVLALAGFRLLTRNIRDAVQDGGNIHARANMLLGSLLAGQAFANAPVAGVHALAYPIGGLFHVAHGICNAIVLPHVMRFNEPVISHLYEDLAAELPNAPTKPTTSLLIERLQRLIGDVGIDARLRSHGIGAGDLESLADDAMLQTRLLPNNAREIDRHAAYSIYEAAA